MLGKNVQTFNQFKYSTSKIKALCYDSNGQILFSGGQKGSHYIDIFKPDEQGHFQISQKLKLLDQNISCLFYCPQEKTLFAGSSDHSIRMWKLKKDGNFKKIGKLVEHTQNITSLWYDCTYRLIFSGSHKGLIKIWKASQNGSFFEVAQHLNNEKNINSISNLFYDSFSNTLFSSIKN